jgi:hypothetical protein
MSDRQAAAAGIKMAACVEDSASPYPPTMVVEYAQDFWLWLCDTSLAFGLGRKA